MSVWVEILVLAVNLFVIGSRSTWACELKSWNYATILNGERVTLHVSVWVEMYNRLVAVDGNYVTLHVSVWVEIWQRGRTLKTMTSRSTWACELKLKYPFISCSHTASRSTWACELKYFVKWYTQDKNRSRSTWACELKYWRVVWYRNRNSHAPRERVSWNCFISVP